MADAYAQAIKILGVSQGGHDVSQAIVAAVSTAALEACTASRDIQFIVGNENFIAGDFIELGHGRDGFAAAVHEGCGN